MDNNLIEIGKIINTHGVRGELKIEPWADSPAFLLNFKIFYIENKPYNKVRSRVHKSFVILQLAEITNLNSAEAYKEKTLFVSRDDVSLPEGKVFIQDLIGFIALNIRTNEEIGTVTDVLSIPAGNLLEIRGKEDHLVPLVPEFVVEKDVNARILRIDLIEGM